MSFVFRGSRVDIEAGGFPGFAPERRAMRIHAGGRPVNSNSLAFLVTVLVLFMVLNSHQMSPNFLLWLVLGVFLMATSLRMYATCQQLQAQVQAHAAAANGFLGHTELRVHVPPTIAVATRGRLQSLRLQLALLDREFDDLDYDALRALDADNRPHAPSMSEEEINALPVFKYKVQAQQGSASARKCDGPSQPSVSSSGSGNEIKQDNGKADGTSKTPEDELTCSVCLEQVVVGDLLRSLPCLHQFHVNCIDPWLRQQGTCPVCKHQVRGRCLASPSDLRFIMGGWAYSLCFQVVEDLRSRAWASRANHMPGPWVGFLRSVNGVKGSEGTSHVHHAPYNNGLSRIIISSCLIKKSDDLDE